jgi:deazaflavin-dependent oxidoreductase (nitroreductase family)
MAEPNRNNWNQQIIEEFRTHGGKVGGSFEGVTLLLLTTTGAKSGQKRINPLIYLLDGERLFIFAAKGGAPTNPDWYHNLVAHPQVTVELGSEQFEATAVLLEGEERDQIYPRRRKPIQVPPTTRRRRPGRSRLWSLFAARAHGNGAWSCSFQMKFLSNLFARRVEAEEGELFQTGASLWGNGRS